MKKENRRFISLLENPLSYGSGKFAFSIKNKKNQILESHEAFLLEGLNRFKTAPQHFQNLLSKGWSQQNQSVFTETTDRFIQEGLIRTDDDFIQNLKKHTCPEAEKRNIESICWITKNRPDALVKSISSFHDNNKAHNRNPDFIVCDDSEDTKKESTICLLKDFAQKEKKEIYYAGIAEKINYLNLYLKKAGNRVPRHVMEFALFDPLKTNLTIGANRNMQLLMNRGRHFLASDDDAVCSIARSPFYKDGLSFVHEQNPNGILYFKNRDALLEKISEEKIDILKIHEDLLGKKAADISSSVDTDYFDIENMNPGFVKYLEQGYGKIAVTSAGVHGDSGMGSAKVVLAARGKTREFLLSEETHYKNSSISREIIRIVNQTTITDSMYLGGFNVGIKNDGFITPYFPIMRNEDVIFSMILRITSPEYLIAHQPWSVEHSPVENRIFKEDSMFEVEPNLLEILVLLLEQFFLKRPPVYDEKRNIQSLGNFISDISSLNDSDFDDYIHGLWLSTTGRFIDYLENLLNYYDYKPSYWAEDVDRYIDSLTHYTAENRFHTPRDLRKQIPDEVSCRKAFRESFRLFGELLIYWPEILSVADEIADEQKYSCAMKIM